MKTVSVTAMELLYLSARLGVDNIWDLDETFSELTEDNAERKIARLQDSLLKKGALLPQLDEGTIVEEETKKLLLSCGAWETVVILSSSEMEKKRERLRFFFHGSGLVRYEFRGDAAVLSSTTKEELSDEVKSFFREAEDVTQTDSLVASAAKLRRIGGLSRNRFLQELSCLGCGKEFSTLIADSLQGNPDICSFVCIQNRNGEEVLKNKLVTLRLPGQGLIVRPEVADGRESIRFTRLSKGQLDETVNSILEEWETDGDGQ